MDFRPVVGRENANFAAVAALCAFQFVFAFVAGIIFAFLPGGNSGLGAVAPLTGAMAYALWAETKAAGSLTPRLARRLAFWATVASLIVSAPYLLHAAHLAVEAGGTPLPPTAWAAIFAVAGLLMFLITWFGLSQGRRMAARARLKKSSDAKNGF
jgi:hypothetical protein